MHFTDTQTLPGARGFPGSKLPGKSAYRQLAERPAGARPNNRATLRHKRPESVSWGRENPCGSIAFTA